MLSDDTEHACMTAQALLTAGDEPVRVARALAWKLRWWLLALPAAVGWGTLSAIARSWIGFSPRRSGVQSAGNGVWWPFVPLRNVAFAAIVVATGLRRILPPY